MTLNNLDTTQKGSLFGFVRVDEAGICIVSSCFNQFNRQFSAISNTESIFIGFIQGKRFLRQSELKIEVICEVIVDKTCE